ADAPPSVTNTATVSGGGETNTANDSASDTTTIAQAADLTITKSHSGNFSPCGTCTFTITVSNIGDTTPTHPLTPSPTPHPPPRTSRSAACTVSWTGPPQLLPRLSSPPPTTGWPPSPAPRTSR